MELLWAFKLHCSCSLCTALSYRILIMDVNFSSLYILLFRTSACAYEIHNKTQQSTTFLDEGIRELDSFAIQKHLFSNVNFTLYINIKHCKRDDLIFKKGRKCLYLSTIQLSPRWHYDFIKCLLIQHAIIDLKTKRSPKWQGNINLKHALIYKVYITIWLV